MNREKINELKQWMLKKEIDLATLAHHNQLLILLVMKANHMNAYWHCLLV